MDIAELGFESWQQRERDFEKFRKRIEGPSLAERLADVVDLRGYAAKRVAELSRSASERAIERIEALTKVPNPVELLGHSPTGAMAQLHAKIAAALGEQTRMERWTGVDSMVPRGASELLRELERASGTLRGEDVDWSRLTGRDCIERARRAVGATGFAQEAMERLRGRDSLHARDAMLAAIGRFRPSHAEMVAAALADVDWPEVNELTARVAEQASNDGEAEVSFWYVDLEPCIDALGDCMDALRAKAEIRKGHAGDVAIGLLARAVLFFVEGSKRELVGWVVAGCLAGYPLIQSGEPSSTMALNSSLRPRAAMTTYKPIALQKSSQPGSPTEALAPPGALLCVVGSRHGWTQVRWVDRDRNGAESVGWVRADAVKPLPDRSSSRLVCAEGIDAVRGG